jgi:4-amino-4-deoxy-L-arabinose transferase-like glycosyltransferase
MSASSGVEQPPASVAPEPHAAASSTRPGPLARVRARFAALPLALWACMAVAVMNAAVWSLIVPSFQGPDEPVHFGYVQYFGETGKIPRNLTPYYTPSGDAEVAFQGLPWSLTDHPSWSAEQNARVERELRRGDLGRVSERAAGYASNNPPLYYMLAAAPYRVAHGGTFYDRMYAARFFSSLLAGLTVGLIFMFLRELLPRRPWAWAVGALVVAFQPVFGFIGGVVNIDNLLWAESALLLWMLARSFRRGLTVRRGVAIGLAVLAGMLTKGSMFGLVPGVLLGLALLVWRPGAVPRRQALRGAVASVGVAAVPMALWLYANQALLDRSGESTSGGLAGAGGGEASIGGQLSYLWQFWLPKLPSQFDWFEIYPQYPLWDTVIQGFVGRFGWFQFGFSLTFAKVATVVFFVIFALAVAELWRCRAALRARWRELLVYGVLALGLIALVGVAGYRYKLETDGNFEQTRYYFPLIAFYGAMVALAARGVGRRYGPLAGIAFVVLAAAHGIFAQLLTVERYFVGT